MHEKDRGDLRIIARQTMLERGLLPDFSTAARRQADGFAHAAEERNVRDLADLLWASIDNDGRGYIDFSYGR